MTICPVPVEVQKRLLRLLLVFPSHERDGHFCPIPRLDQKTFGDVGGGVVTARHLANLEHRQRARLNVIVINRVRRDHGGVAKPQHARFVVCIVAEPCGIGRFRKRDLVGITCVHTNPNLVEPLAALGNRGKGPLTRSMYTGP